MGMVRQVMPRFSARARASSTLCREENCEGMATPSDILAADGIDGEAGGDGGVDAAA